MSKNVVVISSTLRQNGNSDVLADQLMRGAQSSGHKVEKISLREKQINFCKGCLRCQQTGRCVIRDDADTVVEKIKRADVIVFATPIYYYEMSGQLKTMLDRTNPLFTSDYNFREVYFMAAAADIDSRALNNAVNGIKGWISCFPKAELKGVFYGTGATDIGDVQVLPVTKTAYQMGREV